MYSLGSPSGRILADGLNHWILLIWICSVLCHRGTFLQCCSTWLRMASAAGSSILQCMSCHYSLGPPASAIAQCSRVCYLHFSSQHRIQPEPSAREEQWQDCEQQKCLGSIRNWSIVWLECLDFDRHKMHLEVVLFFYEEAVCFSLFKRTELWATLIFLD